MQSAGQAAAQSEQPTHFSSPGWAGSEVSNLCSRWRPRKRGYTGTFSSGYWIVTGPSMIRANVVFSPRSVSPNVRYAPAARLGAGWRMTSMTSADGSYGDISGSRGDNDCGDQDVESGQRQQH